jgi:hypothetical protein
VYRPTTTREEAIYLLSLAQRAHPHLSATPEALQVTTDWCRTHLVAQPKINTSMSVAQLRGRVEAWANTRVTREALLVALLALGYRMEARGDDLYVNYSGSRLSKAEARQAQVRGLQPGDELPVGRIFAQDGVRCPLCRDSYCHPRIAPTDQRLAEHNSDPQIRLSFECEGGGHRFSLRLSSHGGHTSHAVTYDGLADRLGEREEEKWQPVMAAIEAAVKGGAR